MYGIGTVARLAQVSVRTLRHYDDLGLLKPARVDPATGYRYYTPDQVLRLHRILVLRDLGVSLSKVGQLIDDDGRSPPVTAAGTRSTVIRGGLASATEQAQRRCGPGTEAAPGLPHESAWPQFERAGRSCELPSRA
jgi:DNA-binding transcriptional MerR regulator